MRSPSDGDLKTIFLNMCFSGQVLEMNWLSMQGKLIGKKFFGFISKFLADIFFPMPGSSKVHKCMIYINVHKNA